MMHPHDHEPTYAATAPVAPVRTFHEDKGRFRWDGVPVKAYKPTGTHFKDITRQVLFGEAEDLPVQLRYFEIDAGGHSTLEQHEHVHAVLILRGHGRVLIGAAIYDVAAFDLVYVPPATWHQFRAAPDEPLGFLCLVACDRDRPTRPDEEEARQLQAHPEVGPFIRL